MGDMRDVVRDVVARVCAETGNIGTLNIPRRESPPPQQPGPSRQISPNKNSKPKCVGKNHRPFDLYVLSCVECDRFCNCGQTYFPETTYPDVLVRSLDKHIVQLSGDMVRASETLSRMVNEFTQGNDKEPLGEDNVIVEREPTNVICITEYRKMDKNGVALASGNEQEVEEKGEDCVDAAVREINRKSFSDYPIRNSARNFGNFKEERQKQSGDKERKDDVVGPSSSVVPTQPTLSYSVEYKTDANSVRQAQITFKVPPLRRGRQFTHYKEDTLPIREDGVTCKIQDLIEIKDKNMKVLALFDQESNVPTLGITKDTLLKVQCFMDMHLDDIEQRVSAKKRLLQFREVSPYHNPGYAFYEDKHSFNTFAYSDWEEEFFNKEMSSGVFFDLHRANQELLIWDLYYSLEKWVFLNRGFPQNMVNGYWDINQDPDYEERDKKNVFGLFDMKYPNPRKNSGILRRTARVNISQVTRLHFKPRWFYITELKPETTQLE